MSGGLAVDDRGEVAFVNDFNFTGVKRFYLVSNHRQGFVRAWHAHRREAKYVTVVQGAALIGAVKIDDWDAPAKDAQVHRYVLSSHKPSVLYIPAGYANGFMSLTDDARLMFFSTSTLEESTGDDIRYDARLWDIWNVVER
jgi:dTDP-4-dehydrorhamnose 3,5-epimerase